MTRKNLGAKPFSYPQPVYVLGTYDADGNSDAMNAAWGGISGPNEMTFCLSPDHKTVENFKATNALTVHVATLDTLVASDYVGIVSANDTADKIAKAGFTTTKSEFVNAPIINELPICLECKVKDYTMGKLTAEIVNVSVDESVMTDGKVDVSKVKPISFDPFNNAYVVLGDKVGNAFADGAKLK